MATAPGKSESGRGIGVIYLYAKRDFTLHPPLHKL